MDYLTWQRIKLVLAEILEKPEGERERFIIEVCRGDMTMVGEVRSLLQAGDGASFLDYPLLSRGR